MLSTLIKQPAEQLDYTIDFTRWLPDDDKILTVEAHVSPEPEPEDEGWLEIVAVHVNENEPAFVTVWAAGGVNNQTYKVTVTVGTEGGRIKEVDFKIRVRDC